MIPEAFKTKMQSILGDEYPVFIEALETKPAVRGMRANLIKTSPKKLIEDGEFCLEALSYADNGFILREERAMGASPYHHAGMVYMQDPGAMASAAAIDIEPDWWVADLCAAPGGKSSQIAERLGEDGFILSNEYVPKRAKIIVGNFERLGVKNAIVTSLDTARLAEMYEGVFNLVVVDAPCSGEGMFRKSEDAVNDWSEDNVRISASRQREILSNARALVKPGGYLLYSTCTYSPEENEENVEDFLIANPDFHLVKVKDAIIENTRPGLSRFAEKIDNIEYTRRFYPHVSDGEGQFLALMQRDENSDVKQRMLYKDEAKQLSKQESTVVLQFFKEALESAPHGRVVKVGENIVLVGHKCPIPKGSVFMSGVMLGEIKGTTLVPHHQFFSAYGELFKNKIYLGRDDSRVEKYIAGEEIDEYDGLKGWCAVFFEGAALGGGKASGGKIKNHYPKGLRTR
jgi:16S rRNA C967 or C1407 C5-methylase (RsmB/RsmF family)/NOL1/NOP2/fmu family ribosome biogenesis protein